MPLLLVEHGADTTSKDIGGFTLLHWAVRKVSVYLARLLVEHVTDTTAKDIDRLTPLRSAVPRPRTLTCLARHPVQARSIPSHRTSLSGAVAVDSFFVQHEAA